MSAQPFPSLFIIIIKNYFPLVHYEFALMFCVFFPLYLKPSAWIPLQQQSVHFSNLDLILQSSWCYTLPLPLSSQLYSASFSPPHFLFLNLSPLLSHHFQFFPLFHSLFNPSFQQPTLSQDVW